MAETTIEWTATPRPDGTLAPGYTFNPWIGCTAVSPACDNCYAEAQNKFRKWAEGWGPHSPRHRTSKSYWRAPHKWNREAEAEGVRRKVFPSLCDPFDNHRSITSGWHGDFWHLIHSTPWLNWLLLTKRPQNIGKMLPESYGLPEWGPNGWPNVWLGTTTEDQDEANRRIYELLRIPAPVHFVSYEPALGPIFPQLLSLGPGRFPGLRVVGDTYDALTGEKVVGTETGYDRIPDGPKLDWVIWGGESGPGARPHDLAWARSVRDQCRDAGVAFFAKQMGGKRKPFPPIPADLMVREWPE